MKNHLKIECTNFFRVNKDDVSFELDDDPVINPSSSTISPPNAEQTQLRNASHPEYGSIEIYYV